MNIGIIPPPAVRQRRSAAPLRLPPCGSTASGGITGHQHLGSAETEAWVRETLRQLIEEYRVTRGFTCLAAGADQLYAELLVAQGIPYTPVLPCRRYDEAFQDEGARKRFNKLLAAARRIVWLDFDRPSQAAYWEAGKEVVHRSDALFAVWDGQVARGLGGTADVVAYARVRGTPIVQLNPLTRDIRLLPPLAETLVSPITVRIEIACPEGGMQLLHQC